MEHDITQDVRLLAEDRLKSKKKFGFTCRPKPQVMDWMGEASKELGMSFGSFAAGVLEWAYLYDTGRLEEWLKTKGDGNQNGRD